MHLDLVSFKEFVRNSEAIRAAAEAYIAYSMNDRLYGPRALRINKATGTLTASQFKKLERLAEGFLSEFTEMLSGARRFPNLSVAVTCSCAMSRLKLRVDVRKVARDDYQIQKAPDEPRSK